MIPQRRWLIGSAADCDLVVSDPAVSPQHCRLLRTARGFVVEDLQSQAGTFVNGVRVPFRVRVTPTDRVTLGPDVPMPWPRWAGEAGETVIHVGRAPDNDVVLDYPVVSPYHARITVAGGQARIEDLDSAHGTALGSPERKITRARLATEDVIYFGWFRLPAAQLLAKGTEQRPKPCPTVTLRGAAMTFGQDPSCEQVLRHPTVAQWHARLTRHRDGLVLEDLASAHGTFVNGQRVHGAARVRPGDIIGLGALVFRLADGGRPQAASPGQATVRARGVTVEVHGRRLLDKVSLTALPGELVGIMGPSGAGKTTLLMALNGYTRPAAGEVLLNGKDLYRHYRACAPHLGYVPQDDIIHRDLTVGQALYYSGRLRLPHLTPSEVRERVREVVRQLRLEGTEDVVIGSPENRGISGGQRKRVNLAMELLTDPLVLFLDEPTTGLSSEEALTVMRLLRDLADSGKTVIVTIHQPSLEGFRLLDNLAVVARDAGTIVPGRLVYYGPAYPDAVHFFNPDGPPGRRPGSEALPEDVLRGLSLRRTPEWADRY